jgi:hypothetical protein
LIGETTQPRVCQVRSQTEVPCGRPAATTVLGVLLCERCAREQEGYFAVGELTQVPRGREPGGDVAATRARRTRPPWAAGVLRRLRERAAGGQGVPFLAAVVVAVSVFAAAACGGVEQARAGTDVADPESGEKTDVQKSPRAAKASAGDDGSDPVVARAGDAEVRTDGAGARAGDAEAGTGGSAVRAGGVRITENGPVGAEDSAKGRDGNREVTLTVTGKPGTKFAGSCSVGGDERTFNGEAPERYTFEPRDEKLACEVRKQGGGTLGILFTDGGSVRSEQRTGAGGGTMEFVYSGGGIVSSQTSSVTVEQSATSSEGSSADDSR